MKSVFIFLSSSIKDLLEEMKDSILIFVMNEIVQQPKQIKKRKKMKDLTKTEWKKQIAGDDNAFILDVRTEEEVQEGYIPEAKHLDFYKGQEFVDELEKLDRSKNYYVYCKSGNRSGQACRLMDQMGFENTNNLTGGFSQWDGDVQK